MTFEQFQRVASVMLRHGAAVEVSLNLLRILKALLSQRHIGCAFLSSHKLSSISLGPD